MLQQAAMLLNMMEYNKAECTVRLPMLTLLLSPASWLKAHNGSVTPPVMLQQPGHALEGDGPQGDSMQIGFFVIAGHQCCQISRQLQALQHFPLGYTHVDLHTDQLASESMCLC